MTPGDVKGIPFYEARGFFMKRVAFAGAAPALRLVQPSSTAVSRSCTGAHCQQHNLSQPAAQHRLAQRGAHNTVNVVLILPYGGTA